MLALGYTLEEALSKVAQTCTGGCRSRLERLVDEINQGTTLTEALLADPGPFPAQFVSGVRLAEEGAQLPVALADLATLLDKTEEHQRAFRFASAYPVFLLILLIALTLFVLFFLGREFTALYASLEAPLPWLTEKALGLMSVLLQPLSVLLIFIALGFFFQIMLGSSRIGLFKFRLPFLGSWLAANQAVLFLRWADYLLKGGLPLEEALQTAAESCSKPLRGCFSDMARQVREGSSLGEALRSWPRFPSLAVWLVQQQEEKETLKLASVADLVQREVDTTRSQGLASVEPVGVLFVGLLILLIVAIFFLPISELQAELG